MSHISETPEDKARKIFTLPVRRWLYGVVGAVTPILVTTGVLSGTVAGQIVAIAAAVLVIGTSGLALANPTRQP